METRVIHCRIIRVSWASKVRVRVSIRDTFGRSVPLKKIHHKSIKSLKKHNALTVFKNAR